MASIFTRIINGEIPCFKVAESADCIAFLDISPVAVGHTLVVPKKEVDRLFDLDDDSFVKLQLFSKQVSRAIESVVQCNRIGVTVIGLEVPHAHIHLIPINTLNDMSFSGPRVEMTKVEMAALASAIADKMS